MRASGHHVWTDAGAHSGGRWWDEIVSHIQTCDVLLAVTSPASLGANACTLERQYAMRLNAADLAAVGQLHPGMGREAADRFAALLEG